MKKWYEAKFKILLDTNDKDVLTGKFDEFIEDSLEIDNYTPLMLKEIAITPVAEIKQILEYGDYAFNPENNILRIERGLFDYFNPKTITKIKFIKGDKESIKPFQPINIDDDYIYYKALDNMDFSFIPSDDEEDF